jgi:hypothetical protein
MVKFRTEIIRMQGLLNVAVEQKRNVRLHFVHKEIAHLILQLLGSLQSPDQLFLLCLHPIDDIISFSSLLLFNFYSQNIIVQSDFILLFTVLLTLTSQCYFPIMIEV